MRDIWTSACDPAEAESWMIETVFQTVPEYRRPKEGTAILDGGAP
jgi:hypothetical protein